MLTLSVPKFRSELFTKVESLKVGGTFGTVILL